MNSNSKLVSKLLPFLTALIVIIAGISWYAVTQSKDMVIPFSSVEKTIKAQNGALVTIEEKEMALFTSPHQMENTFPVFLPTVK